MLNNKKKFNHLQNQDHHSYGQNTRNQAYLESISESNSESNEITSDEDEVNKSVLMLSKDTITEQKETIHELQMQKNRLEDEVQEARSQKQFYKKNLKELKMVRCF